MNLVTTTDFRAFFESQSQELAAKAKRVRNLIGDRHWYTDGAFKEALLLEAIRQRLPAGVEAKRGFVLSRELTECSTEQDCVIADRMAGVPVFEAVDFHLVQPQRVVALLSAKTTLKKGEFLDAMEGIASALRIVAADPLAANPFLAAFFFDEDSHVKDETLVEWIKELVPAVGWPICRKDPVDGDQVLGPLWLFTLHDRCMRLDHVDESPRIRIYSIRNVAAAILLHLLETATFEFRDKAPSAAWSILDDESIGQLTLSRDL